MLKYPCLVLDHDDTVVQTMKTMSYPFFLYGLGIFRPGMTMSFPDYVRYCNTLGFADLCREHFAYTDEEMDREHDMWMEYVLSHTPAPYPGIDKILQRQRAEGGRFFVVSHSRKDSILRDYRLLFGTEPDDVYGWERPEEQRKPNPYPLQDIMARFGYTPEQILVVDDMKLSCQMAKPVGVPVAYAGWNGFGLPEHDEQMRQLCDFSFDSTEKLMEFLFD